MFDRPVLGPCPARQLLRRLPIDCPGTRRQEPPRSSGVPPTRGHALMNTPADRPPSRVIVENVQPCVDGGRFPAKRTAGEEVTVTADITADGHEVLAAVLRYRRAGAD